MRTIKSKVIKFLIVILIVFLLLEIGAIIWLSNGGLHDDSLPTSASETENGTQVTCLDTQDPTVQIEDTNATEDTTAFTVTVDNTGVTSATDTDPGVSTDVPTSAPADAPEITPTYTPANKPTEAPDNTPTEAPATTPTEAPTNPTESGATEAPVDNNFGEPDWN